MNVLEEANSIIYGPRRAAYGHPWTNFSLTARLWSPILGVEVTPEQVAMCMMQLKIAREVHAHSRDSIVDIAGYAGTLQEVAEKRKETMDELTRNGQGVQGYDGMGGPAGEPHNQEAHRTVEGAAKP